MLRSRPVVLFIALVLAAGCAPKRIPVSDLSGFGELNERVRGKTVQIVVANGDVIHARNILVQPDSLSWASRWTGEMASGHWTGERASMPTADVRAIRIHRTSRGALKGLAYGIGWGLALAVPVFLSRPHEPYREVFFLAGAVFGALVGIPTGMIADGDVYEFTPLGRP